MQSTSKDTSGGEKIFEVRKRIVIQAKSVAIRNQTPYESCHRLAGRLKSSGRVLVVLAEKKVTIAKLIKLAMEGTIAHEAKALPTKTISRGVKL